VPEPNTTLIPFTPQKKARERGHVDRLSRLSDRAHERPRSCDGRRTPGSSSDVVARPRRCVRSRAELSLPSHGHTLAAGAVQLALVSSPAADRYARHCVQPRPCGPAPAATPRRRGAVPSARIGPAVAEAKCSHRRALPGTSVAKEVACARAGGSHRWGLVAAAATAGAHLHQCAAVREGDHRGWSAPVAPPAPATGQPGPSRPYLYQR
jgi:hypothetical protein